MFIYFIFDVSVAAIMSDAHSQVDEARTMMHALNKKFGQPVIKEENMEIGNLEALKHFYNVQIKK